MAYHEKDKASLELVMESLEFNDDKKSDDPHDFASPSASAASAPLFFNYSEKAIRKLSIALRFLLHPRSRLNRNMTNLHLRYQDFNPKFNVKYVNKLNKMVDSLWTSHSMDINEIRSIHKFWDQWCSDDFDPEDDEDTDEEFKLSVQQLSAQISTVHTKFRKKEKDRMKTDYLDFIAQYNETYQSQEETIMEHKQSTDQDPDNVQKITALQTNVLCRKSMANWLNTYKQPKHKNYRKCLKIFKPFRWQKDVSYKLPMNEWNWKQVVSFIEDNEALKHFSSIFYEFHIDGQELCAMTFKHFEYLIEHALIENQKNVFETDFDKFKRIKKDDKNWQLSAEIADLLKYIHRGRIQSHVISRYYLIYEILKHKKHNDPTATVIYNIIKLLQPDYASGPKQFWKMNAYFFCKLDNFLAVLVADAPIRKIYRKLFPTFLNNDEEELHPNTKKPPKRRVTETRLRVVQTGWRNWRMKSLDPVTNQSEFVDDDEPFTPFTPTPKKHTSFKPVPISPFTPNRKQTGLEKVYTDYSRMRASDYRLNVDPVKKKRRYDACDFCADYCCMKENKCNQYTHAIPRVYFKALSMFIFASLFGYLFITLWYYHAAIIATDDAMKLTMEAIGEREVNFATYQLFQPQSLQHIAIGELKIYSEILDAIEVNDTDPIRDYVENGSLDYLFVDWSHQPNTKHIQNFILYNNNTNVLIGGQKLPNDTFIITVYNGSCVLHWKYDEITAKRDINQPFGSTYCDFNPRSRPWYTELVEIGGMNNSIWTKPYLFYTKHVYGVTLSTMMQYRDTVYILLNELTVESVMRLYDKDRLLLPEQTVLMLVTPSLSVLASSIEEIDLYEIEDCDDCHAEHRMITKSMEYMRGDIEDINANISLSDIGYVERQFDEYWINIFAFDALYMESLLYDKATQRGYIVITYNEVHWDSIESTYTACWIICGLSLFVGVLFIIYNIKFHRAEYFKREQSKYSDESTNIILSPGGTRRTNGYRQTLITESGSTPIVDKVNETALEIGHNEYIFHHTDDEKEEDEDVNQHMVDPFLLKQPSIQELGDDEDEKDELLYPHTVPLQKDNNNSANNHSSSGDDNDNDSKTSPISSKQLSTSDYKRGKSAGNRSISQLSRSKVILNKMILEPRICQLTQSALVIVLFIFTTITFMIIIALWSYTASNSIEGLIDDIMTPQEWNVVRDKVFQLIESAESAKHIIENRLHAFSNASDIFDGPQFDEIFTNTMSSFVNQNNLYNQYFVYIGKPDGTFRGSRVLSTNSTQLLITVRDTSTNFTRFTHYTDSENIMRDKTQSEYSTNNIYDPRCRPWYLAAIRQRFGGTLSEAFPGDTWDTFSEDDINSLSRQTQACKDAVEEYIDLFANQSNRSYSAANNTSEYLVWTTYAFVSLNAIGITASAVIKDKDTNNVLAVVGIDYTLNGLSQILNESIGADLDEDQNWHSWIFNADKEDPYVIATSDFDVLTTTDSVEGCLQFAMEQDKMPYSVYNHPELYIRIMSSEVLDHYGADADVWIVNDSMPFELQAPIDYPISQGGRITYYPDGSGLDWFIMKLVDVHTIKSTAGDAVKTTATVVMLILVLNFICFREITIQFGGGYNEDEHQEEDEEDEDHDYLKDMFKMQVLIEGAANRVWTQMCKEDDDHVMTTDKAKEFLAARANQHIINDNDRNQIFIRSVLQYTQHQNKSSNKWCNELQFLSFMFSNYYNVPSQIVIVCHLAITFSEPPNPTSLRRTGLSTNLIVANTICIVLEFIFGVLFNTFHRYLIFSMKREHLITIYELYYGKTHKWTKKIRDKSKSAAQLTANGPHLSRYILRICIWSIIVIDFLLRCALRVGIFSYRIPALPFLFIVENRHVWDFCWEFVAAIRYASDVVISYFAFIIIFAICAMSLFGETDINTKELAVDSFDSITRSIITAFVYISTSENYDTVVSETFFENSSVHPAIVVNAIAICLIFVVFGLFSFVPMIIHRFEESFNKTRIQKHEINKYKKCEALIAAFIMLDMDGNLEIDRSEFQQLVTHSVLIDKNKLFDIFNADGDDAIDINEFVSALCKQRFRSKMLYHGEKPQNKFQAWMECNIFRRYRNRLLTFIILVLPVFGIALLRGLTDINDETVDFLLTSFFILNFVDISLRWLSFGNARFFDLARYPNPPYTTAAINKYSSKRKIPFINTDDDSSKVIRLSASDRKWVVNNLRDTRPQSILEKSVLSICHRLEAIAMILSTIMFFVSRYMFNMDFSGYHRHLFELAIFVRFFTLLRSNQKLLYVVFTVFPQFASLIIFLVLFIYSWARLGSTLFGDGDREIITENVYPESAMITTNFSTLAYSMLTLIQLMIGEGWHVVMYYNVMSTSLLFSSYFIFYIGWVTIIIANVFVGLFLADIDELKTTQETDDTLAQFVKRSRKFKDYAKNKLKELHFELQQIDDKRRQKLKQIDTFKHLLQANKESLHPSILDQSMFGLLPSQRGATFALFD